MFKFTCVFSFFLHIFLVHLLLILFFFFSLFLFFFSFFFHTDRPSLDRPKFRSFFPLPSEISLFLLSLWGSSLGILVVFLKARALKCARLEFSGCHVKPGGFGAARASHDNPRTPNVHIQGSRRFE